ncbi:valine--tRNA ligase [Patescibacteria group bacterium]|nr:valine--tRNA ligase [Patescibacteria group bacterium]
MKYNFTKQELKWQKFWEKEKIYAFQNNGKVFSIDADPPTLSGQMHIGHVSSYTHEDIVARYKRMAGFNVFFPFGVDDNGLPTAKLVEKENKVRFFDMQKNEFLKLCNQTIKKLLPEFISSWKRIGVSCDFTNTYSTISPEVQKLSQEMFLKLIEKKRAYQKESPTLWCSECKTAIAQAELEDKETKTEFCFLEFKLKKDKKVINIATTRPELLPSCVAIFVNPKDKRHKKLIGETAIVPLFGQEVKILADKKVEIEKGTGIVMCCTFGDTTDIEWFLEYKLPLSICIDKNARLNDLAKEFKGLTTKQARETIKQALEEKGILKDRKEITHMLNVHERCGTEIEILSTKQWFVKYLDLKKEFLAQSGKFNWYPPFMKARLDNWIKGIKWDWCISRQRYFGIPIPVWYCKDCGEIILPDKKDLPIDPTHTKPKKKCSCGGNDFIPETDVLDTWATSSLTPQIAKAKIPMSLRPQAHDIINFWLFYTLARSYIHFKKLPFKDVFISGFVLDEKGEKMSKSKGNVIKPENLIENYGADAIRYWASQAGMGEDIRYSEEEIRIGKRTVTKIWNASQFCLMHLKAYKPNKAELKFIQDEDKWIFTKLSEAIENYCEKMDKYEYQRAKEIIDSFFWNDFCDNYLEIIKHRVYDEEIEKKSLRAAQFTLYNILLSVLKLYAPIMPFITEEIYQSYFIKFEKEKSIHLTFLPKPDKKFLTEFKDFELVIEAIAQIRKYKSEHHLSMNAEVESIKIKSSPKIKKYLPLLGKLMSVKQIKIS